MERAPFAFAFFRGSCGPRLSVKRDGALFYCIAAGEKAEKDVQIADVVSG